MFVYMAPVGGNGDVRIGQIYHTQTYTVDNPNQCEDTVKTVRTYIAEKKDRK